MPTTRYLGYILALIITYLITTFAYIKVRDHAYLKGNNSDLTKELLY